MSSLDLLRRAGQNVPRKWPELIVQGVLLLIVLLGIAFAAGYFTREFISRRRRAEARRWRGQPEWLDAQAPANDSPPPGTGELGVMLDRWETRARARRAS